MIDKKISLGTIMTICTVLCTFMFSVGATSNKIESLENSIDDNRKKIMTNKDKVQSQEVGQGRIETKIDAVMNRFDKLENLILENR